ncbi:MAG: endonuclease Q family protein [Atribacterota bacterium]|nr:endonuclease Q family protein [Atribacterota bacterium]
MNKKKRKDTYFADLHVHIGRDTEDLPVKVTASRKLTFPNIARECLNKKGIDIVGIVDCASPRVIRDIEKTINSGEMRELEDGGVLYQDSVTVILGAEIETKERNGNLSHQIAFFPYFADIKEFSIKMQEIITNPNLSSQNSGIDAQEFFNIVDNHGGIVIPAHIFTPHKSMFGSCVSHLSEMFNTETIKKIPAVELGLSADTFLADHLKDLENITFLTNSDAHSLPKIGREYNLIKIEKPTYKELVLALNRKKDRRVLINYGLDPRLGKYHRTFCEDCNSTASECPPVFQCPRCGSKRVTKGVLDRIIEISENRESVSPVHRSLYCHQVALNFVPGVGRKTLENLHNYLGTEMNILHNASYHKINQVTGSKIAKNIIAAREGKLSLLPGGGGKYGKAIKLP